MHLTNFIDSIAELWKHPYIAVDTETTGLRGYHGDLPFSVIVATFDQEFYFNFNSEKDIFGNVPPEILGKDEFAALMHVIFTRQELFKANAKFDLTMLYAYARKLGIPLPERIPQIHDVIVVERLLNNDQIKISLETVAKEYGYEKDQAVEDFIEQHRLTNKIEVPGKKTRYTEKYYQKVPYSIIVPYAKRDARITYDIALKQRQKLDNFFRKNKRFDRPNSIAPDTAEARITEILFGMEQTGILCDRAVIAARAREHQTKYEFLARKFHDQTRSVLIDSAKVLGPIFVAQGQIPPKTEKENDSVSDDWLERINTPLSQLVREYRTHYKLANTFYKNYLWHLDSKDYIHANINQSGTRTGRMSYSNPNLQQAPASEVRQVFIAPQDFCCVSIDWDQQEYRMMLDYAQEMGLIEKVKSGLDVHTATAELAGVSRKEAKTLNFLLLYGGGVVKLAMALLPVTLSEKELWYIWKVFNEWDLEEDDKKWEVKDQALWDFNLGLLKKARSLREQYFEKLPAVKDFIKLVRTQAFDAGWIPTWTGRRLKFKKEFSYKAPNALIQGGASDVAKMAMISIDTLLRNRKSCMVAQIHDEFWFYIHKDELGLTKDIVHIMENTFPHRHLGLTSSVEYSWKNFFDLEKAKGGLIEKARDQV